MLDIIVIIAKAWNDIIVDFIAFVQYIFCKMRHVVNEVVIHFTIVMKKIEFFFLK